MTRRTRTKVIMTVVVLALPILFPFAKPRLEFHPGTGGSFGLVFKCGDDEHWFYAGVCPTGISLASASIGYGRRPGTPWVDQKAWVLERPSWWPWQPSPPGPPPSIVHNP